MTRNKQPRNQKKSTQKRRRSNGKKRYRRNRRSKTGMRFQALPAAYRSHVKPKFEIISRSANSLRVTGRDLVYTIPDALQAKDKNVFAVITANPAYWKGTRVAAFAAAYMNYRPIRMTFSYIPQVSVVQPGTIIYGTLWNGAALPAEFQQTLATSNGGNICQCYLPAESAVTLGSNLQQNLFTLAGDLNATTNPFVFVSAVAGSDVVPGYWMVNYTYEFKNPIGSSWTYEQTFTPDLKEEVKKTNAPNMSAILGQGVKLLGGLLGQYLGPGTVLDVERVLEGPDSNEYVPKFYYRGTEVLQDITDKVTGFLFGSGQGPSLTTPSNENIVADLQHQITELEKQISGLNMEIEDLDEQLQFATQKIQDQTITIQSQNTEIAALESTNQALTTTNASLEQSINSLNAK